MRSGRPQCTPCVGSGTSGPEPSWAGALPWQPAWQEHPGRREKRRRMMTGRNESVACRDLQTPTNIKVVDYSLYPWLPFGLCMYTILPPQVAVGLSSSLIGPGTPAQQQSQPINPPTLLLHIQIKILVSGCPLEQVRKRRDTLLHSSQEVTAGGKEGG